MSGGCGCLAFMGGAAVAIALFGAHLLSGWGARALEEILSSGLNATVEVSGVDLSWSRRQTIRSVTVVGPDGRQVAQASAELPSLLDLLWTSGSSLDVRVDVLSLRSRVDEEGIDDIQRITRVGDQDLLELVLRGMARRAAQTSWSRGLSVDLSVKDWTVDDTASGRGLVSVRDSEVSLVCQAGRAELLLERALVSWPGLREPATVSAAVTLGSTRRGGPLQGVTVQGVQLSSAGVPLDVARSLGVIPRQPRSPSAGTSTPEAWMHGQALDLLMADLERGAQVTVDVRPGSGGSEAVGRFEVDGAGMKLSLAVEWEDGQMVPGDRPGGAPLEVLLRDQRGGAARVLEGLLPERFSAQQLGGAVDWNVSSRDFALPFAPVDLLDFRPAMLAAMADMRLEADARVEGARVARVRVQVSQDSAQSLDLDHYLTSFAFDGVAGSSVRSSWLDGKGRLANLSLRTAGARNSSSGMNTAGAMSRAARGVMEVTAFDVPSVMLWGPRALPPELLALLPERLLKIRLEDLPLPRIGDGGPSGPTGQIKLDIHAEPENRFFGFLEGARLSLPLAQLTRSVDEALSAALFERLLPWFVGVRPQPEGESSLVLDVVNYSVDLAAPEFRETGQMSLKVGSMEVQLQPGLIGTHFDVEAEEWIEWGPEQVTMELDEDIIRYRKAQIPLGGDAEPVRLSGIQDRGDAVLSIQAVVPANVLVGAGDLGILPAQLTLTGPSAALDLAVDRDIIAPLIETIRGGQ